MTHPIKNHFYKIIGDRIVKFKGIKIKNDKIEYQFLPIKGFDQDVKIYIIYDKSRYNNNNALLHNCNINTHLGDDYEL